MAAAKKAQQEMYGALLTKREELVDTLEKKLTVMPETSRECVVILPDETQFTIPVPVPSFSVRIVRWIYRKLC